jgi:nucleoside-diphosphate-sugar epimerase
LCGSTEKLMEEPNLRDLAGARVLVTGATGLVGSELLEQLSLSHCERVTGVSRPRSAESLDAVGWDMSREPPPAALDLTWDVIIHAAANTRWSMPASEAMASNVRPIAALQSLVSPGTLVIHVSTAYATGLSGDVHSQSLADYRNTYEWSKACGERLAQALYPKLTVVRPPLTIGRRSDGRAARFSGMYLFLRGIASGTVPAIVGSPDAYLDVVPVDDLAALIIKVASENPSTRLPSIRTIAGGDQAPRVNLALNVMLDALNAWRTERGRPLLASPPLLTPASWNRFFLPFAREHLTERQLHTLGLLSHFEPYLQIADPIEVTDPVGDIAPAIAESVRYWASTHARIAGLAPRPWGAAA